MQSLRVALGERAYPIHVGDGVLDAADHYRAAVDGRRVAVVTSEPMAGLYLPRLRAALGRAGASSVTAIPVEPGEGSKRWETIDRICGALLEARLGRDAVLVALGGGVIGDLTGFAAAVYQRGIPFLQVPTTLLAQVDSSVGGKTGINHALGKNMIGAFHQPLAVIADVGVLSTLTERELAAGVAEVIKHGFILDDAFTRWLEQDVEALLARRADAMTRAIIRSCEIKADVVSGDEREQGARALLNFGHTFGHAIEAGAGYGAWLHGEAVGAGMVMAAELSRRLGMIDAGATERVRSLVARARLPVRGLAMPPARYLELMAVDKKVSGGMLRFVLLEAVGRAVVRGGVPEAEVVAAVGACLPA